MLASAGPVLGVLPDPPKPKPTARTGGGSSEAEARKRADEERRAREALLATVVVRSDAPCVLKVDGQTVATLGRDEPHTFTAPAGEQYVDCTSTEVPSARHSSVFTTKAREKFTLSITLSDQIGAVRRAMADQAQSRRAADAEAAAKAAAAARRWMGMGEPQAGVMRDGRTGLEWSVADNGDDIAWEAAQRWCASRGPAWRLPSAAELEALHDPSGQAVARCGSARCKVSARFQLSEAFFWSADGHGSAEAWSVGLGAGRREALPKERADAQRALCVRGP